MAILLKPIYDVEGKVVALGELAIDEEAQLPGPLAFPDGTVQLTAATGNGGGVIVQDVPPQDPKSGQVWFESDTGKNFIYYLNEDGSGQWIESAQPTGPAGATGETGITTTTIKEVPPAEPLEGEVWFESDSGNTYVWYINPTSGEGSWVNTCVLVGGASSGMLEVGTVEQRPATPVTGNLRFNTTYDRLEVFGNSFWQLLKFDKEPSPPTVGETRVTGSTTVDVDFTPHPDAAAENVISYTAVSYPGGVTTTLVTTDAGTINVTGLDPNTVYQFKVRANSDVAPGNLSEFSNEIITWTVPDAPAIGEASFSSHNVIDISYTAPTFTGGVPITSFTAVTTPGDLTATVETSESGVIQISGALPETQYTVRVYATNQVGSGASSSESNQVSVFSYPFTADLYAAGGGGGGEDSYGDTFRGGAGGAGGFNLAQSSTIIEKQTMIITVGSRGLSGYAKFGGSLSCGSDGTSGTKDGTAGGSSIINLSGLGDVFTVTGGGGGTGAANSFDSPGGAAGEPGGVAGEGGGGYRNGCPPAVGGDNGTGYGKGGNSNCWPADTCPQEGGNGFVVLRVPTVSYSGEVTGEPVITTDGEYTVLSFSQSGTYKA